jgi:hypothetical protein
MDITTSETEPDPFDAIVDAPFDSALSERYLVYALSTITARSLPDLRDGLKPVHRRLLWAMRQLKLDPASAFKKSARVVGDVIGKYHPHGDASVYDAMVRLAQTFALRYPLVEGQGNFGNIDGDNAAAYRYTEARLTPTAIRLMAGLDEGTVDFMPTYNGEEEEPEIFPGLFPNLLPGSYFRCLCDRAGQFPRARPLPCRRSEGRSGSRGGDRAAGRGTVAAGHLRDSLHGPERQADRTGCPGDRGPQGADSGGCAR